MLDVRQLLGIKMPGDKPYSIAYLAVVVEQDIPDLPKIVREGIKRAIEERLATKPMDFGEPLRHSLRGYRRLRVGDYRIVYGVEVANHTVQIMAIKHRKDIYKNQTVR